MLLIPQNGNKIIYCRKFDYFCIIIFIKIESQKITYQDLISQFGNRIFSTEDIANLYHSRKVDLKTTTLNWRIYDWVKKGEIERIGKGLFKIGETTTFQPVLDVKLKTLHNKVSTAFPFVQICVWNTSLINEFTQHISNVKLSIIEVDKDISEAVFLFLKEQNLNVFINPSDEILEQYIISSPNPIIIKNLLSESPLQTISNYNTITIEKLLVDLFSEKYLFNFYQGREFQNIIKNGYDKYTVNNTKLLRYASRRGKKEELKLIINQIIGNKL